MFTVPEGTNTARIEGLDRQELCHGVIANEKSFHILSDATMPIKSLACRRVVDDGIRGEERKDRVDIVPVGGVDQGMHDPAIGLLHGHSFTFRAASF
jgi:hypothetical protein